MRAGSVDGLITSMMQVVYDSGELAAAATTLTISGLNGDVDEEYEIIIRVINNNAGAIGLYLRPNNDSGANQYGCQYLVGEAAVKVTARLTTNSAYTIYVAGSTAQNYMIFSTGKLLAKSGSVRTFINKVAEGITGTTVNDMSLLGQSWLNTADNITSLVLTSVSTDGIGIGSRVILLKKVTYTSSMKTGVLDVKGTVKNAWQEIYRTELGAAVTSLTISSLTGNTDVLYRLKARIVSGAANCNFFVRPNNDSTAGIYGNQILIGNNATATAARDTSETYFWLTNTADNDSGDMVIAEMVLFAKSGYVRTALVESAEKISTTTVTQINLYGQSYNETSTEITSLVILSDVASGLGIGTQIVLERLNL
jgi:hypothetical protein